METEQDFILETNSINPIPSSARHGNAKSLFAVWFGSNTMMVTITTGLIAITTGFSLFWAGVGLLIGILVGAIFMAYHSAQGPKLGLPQMIQSRAQFGVYGATLPLVLTLAMYFGFTAAGGVLAAEAVNDLIGLPVGVGIVLTTVASFLLALYGYNIIHQFEKWCSYAFAVVFVVFTAIMIFGHYPMKGSFTAGGFILGPFLFTIALAAIFEITYAPYVSDYSRYLPEASSATSVTWWTTAGIAVPMLLFGLLGLLLVTIDPNVAAGPSQLLAVIAKHAPIWLVVPFFVFVILGEIWANYLDVYTAGLVTLAMDIKLKRWQTAVICGLGASLLSAYAVVVTDFHTAYETFLILTYLWAPAWTAVVLIDFFWLRRSYRPLQVLRRHGPYWFTAGFNLKAITAWVLGTICALGFVNYPNLFTYPTFGWAQHMVWFNQGLINSLHQADISGLISAMVAAVIYLLLTGPLRGAASVPGDQGAP